MMVDQKRKHRESSGAAAACCLGRQPEDRGDYSTVAAVSFAALMLVSLSTASIVGQPVRPRFVMQEYDLYSLRFE